MIRSKAVERMENKSNLALIDRLEYFMKYPDEHILYEMCSQEERKILRTIQKFEHIRYLMAEKEYIGNDIGNRDDIAEIAFLKRASERNISFCLKEQMIKQINVLLGGRSMDGHFYMVSAAEGKKSD